MVNLEHLAVVAEYQSISAASSVLAITQPALTRSIMRLEDVLGMRMLERSPRGVTLTECGKALVEHVHAATVELNKALTAVQAIRGVNEGRINCGAGGIGMAHILPIAVSRAKRKLDKVQINLFEGRTPELLYKLKNCELDLVLGIEQPDDDLFANLICEPLVGEEFHFCVSARHQLAGQQNLDIRDLMSRERIVIPMLAATPLEKSLNLELSRHGCELGEYRVETVSQAVMRKLIYEDDYVALCSSIWFHDDIRSGVLKVLAGNWNSPKFDTMLFRRESKTKIPSSIFYFINEIKNSAKTLRSRMGLLV